MEVKSLPVFPGLPRGLQRPIKIELVRVGKVLSEPTLADKPHAPNFSSSTRSTRWTLRQYRKISAGGHRCRNESSIHLSEVNQDGGPNRRIDEESSAREERDQLWDNNDLGNLCSGTPQRHCGDAAAATAGIVTPQRQ